jgi:hypothetical protein
MQEDAPPFPCPCCGHLVFDEPTGSYDICEICYWEDDAVQLIFPDLSGAANKVSLIEAQRNYLAFGACEEPMRSHVRPPAAHERRDEMWRPLDETRDDYLHWGKPADHDRWELVRGGDVCIYYWRPEYWLRKSETC